MNTPGSPTDSGVRGGTKPVWNSISRRIDFAAVLGTGRLPGPVAPRPERLRLAMGSMLSARAARVADEAAGPLHAVLLLGSPDFMRR